MGQYRIKAVSRMLGVRPELLRMWERRYHLFKPQRAGNRYREFDDEDVQLLRYLCDQIAQGRAIGELAAEGREAILKRLAPVLPAPVAPQYATLVEEFFGYVQQLDKRRLETRLAESLALVSFATLLTDVLPPLMRRVGESWEAGQLSAASEHFLTVMVKQRIFAMLLMTTPAPGAPLLLCACPPGERHELGVLTFAYTMQQQGWQVCYLGPDLPIEALLYGCQRLQPALVALSCTHTVEATPWVAMLREIDRQVASAYPTSIGGQAVQRYQHLLQLQHVQLSPSLGNAPTPGGMASWQEDQKR